MIIVAGFHRSGSTWLYNCVRLLAPNHKVIKEHRYNYGMATSAHYVFTSTRNIVDIKKSWKQFKNEDLDDWKLNKWVQHQIYWNKHTSYLMEFERMVNKPHVVIREIAQILNADPAGIYEKLQEIQPPEIGQDPETLLFHNHISSYEEV